MPSTVGRPLRTVITSAGRGIRRRLIQAFDRGHPGGEVDARSHPDQIAAVQRLIGDATGRDCAVTGRYDKATVRAVRMLQGQVGLRPTGRADPHTISAAYFRASEARSRAAPRKDAASIRPGSRKARVKAVQQLINRSLSAKVPVDGVYGDQTLQAVERLQNRLLLPQTGRTDWLTFALGQERARAAERAAAQDRRFVLHLPCTPPGGSAPPTRRRTVIVSAPRKFAVPRVLERKGGLAGYEPESLACWLAAVERQDGGAIIDVGANIGLFGVLAAMGSTGTTVAFEPTPELAATARRLAETNGLPLQIEEAALDRKVGGALFYLSKKSDVANSLNRDFRPGSPATVVAVDTLDDYCTRTGIIPGLIKIDTESTEPDVLAGGRRILADHRPWLLMEVLTSARTSEIRDELQPLGYSWYHVRDDPALVAQADLSGTSGARNWLFTPEPVDKNFEARVKAWRAAIDATPPPVTAPQA